jgi:polysaccharide deacetylase 2 family uncharacterized protein YibQ
MIRWGSDPGADELSAPLGQNAERKASLRLPNAIPRAVAGLLTLSLLAVIGWIVRGEDPMGGEPVAVVATDLRALAGKKPDDVAQAAAKKPDEPGGPGGPAGPSRYDGPDAAPSAAPAPGTKTVTVIDGSTGKREQVVIPAGPGDAPAQATPGDQRVTESSRHGPIPRVGPDGARPADVYAQPVQLAAANSDRPRIAILITGLGIGATGTSDALAKLPPAVTLAFAPYGADLERLAGRARASGHEVVLQVPMEPFDYPDNDPGPRTLLTSLAAEQNVDRLHWLMSRFQGYVAIANYMGARFTATEQALGPVLRETAKRGLIYVDDGSSPRSLASQIAGAHNAPFAKADLVLDAVPTPVEIDRALSKLETLARERGMAVGVASSLPVAIERVARWSKTVEGRGVVLVPISAAAGRAKQS